MSFIGWFGELNEVTSVTCLQQCLEHLNLCYYVSLSIPESHHPFCSPALCIPTTPPDLAPGPSIGHRTGLGKSATKAEHEETREAALCHASGPPAGP